MTVRMFLRDNEGFYFPDEVLDAFYHVLEQKYPNWWGEVNWEEFTERWQTSGIVWENIWLFKADHDKHCPEDISIIIGRYIPSPRFRGTWYYFDDPKDIERRLRTLVTKAEANRTEPCESIFADEVSKA